MSHFKKNADQLERGSTTRKVTYGKKDGGIVSSRKEKEKWATGLESSTILKFKEAGDQWFSVSVEVRMRINQLNL